MAATANGGAMAAAHLAAPAANGDAMDSTQHSSASSGDAAALQLLQEFLQVQARRAEVYSRFNAGFRQLLDDGQERVFAGLMQEVTPMFNAASQQVIHIESCLKSAAVNRPDLAALLRAVQEHERSKLRLTLSWQALRAAHASGRFSWQDAADRPRSKGLSAAAATAANPKPQPQQQQLMALLEQMQLEQAAQQAAAAADNDVSTARGSDQGCSSGSGSRALGLPAAAVKPGFYEQQMQRAVADAALAAAASGGDSEHHMAGSSSDGATPAAAAAAAAANGHCCGHHHHHHDHPPPSDPLEPNNPNEPNEAEFNAAVKEALMELDSCVGNINELLDEVREAVGELQECA